MSNNTVTLEDVAVLRKDRFNPLAQKSRKYIGLEHIEPGTGRLKSTGESDNTKSQKAVFQHGDVLFNKLRPYLKKYWYAEFEGVCTTEILVIQNKPGIEGEYLYYLVSSDDFIHYINSRTFGTKMPRADWGIIKDYQFFLPAKKDQLKVVNLLRKSDAVIEATRKSIEKTELFKKGLMQELIEFNQTVPLGELIENVSTGVSVKSHDRQISDTTEKGVLKTSAVSYLRLKLDQHKVIRTEDLNRASNPLRKGTILVSRMNTPELVGANALVDKDSDNIFLPDRIWSLDVKPSTSPEWLNYVLQVLFNNGTVGRLATGTSQSMRNISQYKYLGLQVPKISLDRQTKVAITLQALDNEIHVNKLLLSKQQNLKRGLIKKVLTGERKI